MGYVACRSCKGTGAYYTKSGQRLDCNACRGTGINQSLYDTKCERCRSTIVYPREGTPPRFCKDCRNEQLEKRCGQYGCDNTIRYRVGQTTIPEYCRNCENKRREGWTAGRCPGTGVFGCGKLIWSPPGKNFTHCRECGDKLRAQKDAEWNTKRCSKCGAEIRYHIGWDKVPDLCKPCKANAIAEWKKKQCTGCGATFSYHVDWENVPDLCKTCRQKRAGEKKAREDEGQHSAAYKAARKEFMRRSLDDPDVASRIKDWIRQEMRTRGEGGYWRSPPGFDVGHLVAGIDDPENFRWENADMNRSRGGKYHR